MDEIGSYGKSSGKNPFSLLAEVLMIPQRAQGVTAAIGTAHMDLQRVSHIKEQSA